MVDEPSLGGEESEEESDLSLESDPYFLRSDRNDIEHPWGGMLVGVALLIGVLLSLFWFLASSNR